MSHPALCEVSLLLRKKYTTVSAGSLISSRTIIANGRTVTSCRLSRPVIFVCYYILCILPNDTLFITGQNRHDPRVIIPALYSGRRQTPKYSIHNRKIPFSGFFVNYCEIKETVRFLFYICIELIFVIITILK